MPLGAETSHSGRGPSSKAAQGRSGLQTCGQHLKPHGAPSRSSRQAQPVQCLPRGQSNKTRRQAARGATGHRGLTIVATRGARN
eukprot:16212636-Heterocapsa_arctica.AAC.1